MNDIYSSKGFNVNCFGFNFWVIVLQVIKKLLVFLLLLLMFGNFKYRYLWNNNLLICFNMLIYNMKLSLLGLYNLFIFENLYEYSLQLYLFINYILFGKCIK